MAHGSSRARLMTMLAAAALALAAPVFVWAQDETAAVGAGKVLDIVPKVLDIVGVSAGIEGTLADLGAKVTEKEIKIALSGDILFDFDKDTLRPDAFPTLEKVAQVLSSVPRGACRDRGPYRQQGQGEVQPEPVGAARQVGQGLARQECRRRRRPHQDQRLGRGQARYPMKSLTAATTPMAASRTAASRSRSRPDRPLSGGDEAHDLLHFPVDRRGNDPCPRGAIGQHTINIGRIALQTADFGGNRRSISRPRGR